MPSSRAGVKAGKNQNQNTFFLDSKPLSVLHVFEGFFLYLLGTGGFVPTPSL